MLSIAAGRANAFKTDWTSYTPPEPDFIGVTVLEKLSAGEIGPVH